MPGSWEHNMAAQEKAAVDYVHIAPPFVSLKVKIKQCIAHGYVRM